MLYLSVNKTRGATRSQSQMSNVAYIFPFPFIARDLALTFSSPGKLIKEFENTFSSLLEC